MQNSNTFPCKYPSGLTNETGKKFRTRLRGQYSMRHTRVLCKYFMPPVLLSDSVKRTSTLGKYALYYTFYIYIFFQQSRTRLVPRKTGLYYRHYCRRYFFISSLFFFTNALYRLRTLRTYILHINILLYYVRPKSMRLEIHALSLWLFRTIIIGPSVNDRIESPIFNVHVSKCRLLSIRSSIFTLHHVISSFTYIYQIISPSMYSNIT